MCEGSAAESVERPKQKIVTDIEQGITREAIKLHISSPLDANRVADVVALQQQVVIECRQEPREETLASVLAINQDFPIGVDDRRGCPLDYRLEPGERLGCERGTRIENDEVSPSHSGSQTVYGDARRLAWRQPNNLDQLVRRAEFGRRVGGQNQKNLVRRAGLRQHGRKRLLSSAWRTGICDDHKRKASRTACRGCWKDERGQGAHDAVG